MAAPGWLRGTVLAVMGCLTPLLATASSGYAEGWSVQREPAGCCGQILSVSCWSARACIAAGERSVLRWSGSKWMTERFPVPPRMFPWLGGVSCSSSRACVATGTLTSTPTGDSKLAAWHWNGRRWFYRMLPSPRGLSIAEGSTLAVSCVLSGACEAVGVAGYRTLAERWDGRRWSLQPVPGAADGSSLTGVSCTSSRACTAVGSVILRWDGRSWSSQRLPRGVISLQAISCPASTVCVAVGGDSKGPIAARLIDGRWSSQRAEDAHGDGPSFFSGVSCSSSIVCTAVGATPAPDVAVEPLVERWTGGRWSIQQLPLAAHAAEASPGSELDSVSCPSSTSCIAVGSRWMGQYAPLLVRWTAPSGPVNGLG